MKLTKVVSLSLAALVVFALSLAGPAPHDDATGLKPDIAQVQLSPQVEVAPLEMTLAHRVATPENFFKPQTRFVNAEAFVNTAQRSVNTDALFVNAHRFYQSGDAVLLDMSFLPLFALRDDFDPVSEAASSARVRRGAIPPLPERGARARGALRAGA